MNVKRFQKKGSENQTNATRSIEKQVSFLILLVFRTFL